MRTVPARPTLKLAFRKCSTKPGRSLLPLSGCQRTAWPSSPATEVNVPHSCATRPGSTLAGSAFAASGCCARKRPPCAKTKTMHAKIARPGSLRSVIALLLGHFRAVDEFGQRFGFRSQEVRCQIARQQRIAFRSGQRFLRVLGLSVRRSIEADERRGEFHLRIVSAQLDGFLDQRV